MKIEVVYGPPCSGKSTYVLDLMTKSSVVFDYDRMVRAMTTRTKHVCEKSCAHVIAARARFTFIRALKDSENDVDAAYILCKWPTDNLKNALSDYDDVTYTMMDTTQEECLSRLEKDDDRPDKKAWEKAINKWFEDHGSERNVKIIGMRIRQALTD